MKYLIVIPFLFFACSNIKQKTVNVTHFDSDFSLYQDTIFVNIEDEMTHALKYHNKFYILFEQQIFEYGDYGKRLYIFSNGKVEKVIDLPERTEVGYLDFFVKNDSIILKPYKSKQDYYFDTQNFIWKEIAKVDDLIFEDDKFYIYSLDFGEWGGIIWFKEKNTGNEYYVEGSTPLVNRVDTTYYLTTFYEVLKIENPLQLNKCNFDVLYENFERRGKEYYRYGDPVGYSIIYNDTTHPYFTPNFVFIYKPRIVNSFVWKNELFHIYEADSITYLAKIENNSIKPIQEIGKRLFFYRYLNVNDKNELLKFRTKDEQLSGLMEVVDNKIFFHYIVNQAELNYE